MAYLPTVSLTTFALTRRLWRRDRLGFGGYNRAIRTEAY